MSDNPQKAEGRNQSCKEEKQAPGTSLSELPDNFDEMYAEWKAGVITARADCLVAQR